ncbi:MAG: nucleoside transporter C-terminal domain-containing protein [Candidatus Palauibacterales bacterium]|nr:nucleoside transporter C-terminal domain-containing protein [Candidatus Palauibacterales bacterium]
MVSWKRVLWLLPPLLLAPATAWGVQQAGSTLIDTGAVAEPFLIRLARGVFALAVILVVLWRFSPRRKAIDWSLVAKGIGLQFVFALLVLKTTWGRGFFSVVNDVFIALIGYTLAGARFVFGSLVDFSTPVTGGEGVVEIGANFAFAVLPTIIFFSALMTVLYYLGVMQLIVKAVAWVMQRTLKTSGAETTSAAGNIFVGQTEAPLLVKPFVKNMTMSELNTVMVGGFATVAGGVMAAYVAMLAGYFPAIAGHLLAASIMAAPAGIVVSKILMPETEVPETRDTLDFEVELDSVNVIDAAAGGAADGMRLALNVGAMLIAFLAIIALINGLLGWGLGLVHIEGITLERLLGWAFAPVAWLIGVPMSDAAEIGTLFGVKMVANEFVAFRMLADGIAAGSTLSPKSVIIATYALTGFANFSSIAIQIGGIGGIAPERRHDLSRLGLRAMLGGTVATWMTATLAGVLA